MDIWRIPSLAVDAGLLPLPLPLLMLSCLLMSVSEFCLTLLRIWGGIHQFVKRTLEEFWDLSQLVTCKVKILTLKHSKNCNELLGS
jgi:hypothetical protein